MNPDEFKRWLLGRFNNRTQAFSYPSQYSQISLRHVLLPNGMIYGEQQYTVRKNLLIVSLHLMSIKLVIN